MTVLRPADDPLDAVAVTYVSAEKGTVGSTIALNTTAEWTLSPVGVNRASGVLTRTMVEAGSEVSAGQVLYEVNLRPVIIAQGDIPSFREIGAGATGDDVTQLQQLLKETGYFSGDVDGAARWDTVQAIKRWQRDQNVEATGEVSQGDVIYVPSLPARVALDSKTAYRGATLSGGEEVLQGLSSAPVFRIPVTETQAGMISTGARVEVTSPEGKTWAASTAGQEVDEESGTVRIDLEGMDNSSVCADQCSQIPVTGQSSLKSQIILVEDVEGLTIPSSALVTDASGKTLVLDDAGARLPVDVKASAKGISVVSGIEPGQKVQVPGQFRGDK